MKALFLDIDGVLNTPRYLSGKKGTTDIYRHLNPRKLALLKRTIEQTQAVIVLSSSWRELFHQMTPVERAASDLLEALANYGLALNDMTASLGGDRPYEIRQWLQIHPEVKKYVILDDRRYQWGNLSSNWVRVNPWVGLTGWTAQRAASILMKQP